MDHIAPEALEFESLLNVTLLTGLKATENDLKRDSGQDPQDVAELLHNVLHFGEYELNLCGGLAAAARLLGRSDGGHIHAAIRGDNPILFDYA